MNTRFSWPGAIAAAMLSCSVLSIPAASQTTPDTAATGAMATTPIATMLRGGVMGELLSVYLPRSDAEVQRLRDEALNLKRSSESEIDGARRLASEADGRVKIMKEELETTKTRRDVAKKANNQAAQAEMVANTRRQTRERAYLENLRDAMRADADRLEAEKSASEARVKALELELQVARRYADLGPAPSAESAAQYRSLLGQMLDAQRQSADRWRDASDKRMRVAERRIQQLQSLSKMSK